MWRFGLFIIFIVTVLSTGLLSVQAQQVRPQEDERYLQLRDDYLFQISEYRTAENRFNLDSAEFYQLQTLASREKAVQSMRPVLKTRAMVSKTYLTALEYLLRNSQGIDVTDKELTLQKHQQSQNYLQSFINDVDSLTDRDAVNQASVEFETEGLRLILETQFRTLTLLSLGRVQASYDQLELATEEFKTDYVANINNQGLKAQIERGLADVDFQNEKADTVLTNVSNAFPPFLTDEEFEALKRKPDYRQNYSSSVTALQTAYSAMKQSVRYLKELETQI